MILVINKKSSLEKIYKDYPGLEVIDVTSKSESEFVKLSPFYPHGNIPIPNSNLTATCVEAVWQGLKVFQGQDIDFECFKNNTMENLKRTERKNGKTIGHRYGISANAPILPYFEARMKIYVPLYKYVLDNIPIIKSLLEYINHMANSRSVILLDYNTNLDVRDISRPLSHAGLIKHYLEGNYPNENLGLIPFTPEECENNKKEEKKSLKEWHLFLTKKAQSQTAQTTLFDL